MDHDIFRDIISFLGFGISTFLLVIHLKNRRTQVSAYRISRAGYRSSEVVLHYIGSDQQEGKVLLRLVLFNPGSIAAIIHSFAVSERVPAENIFLRFLGLSEWRRIEGSRWWPTKDITQTNPKFLAEEYENLYVDSHRTILVTIPGMIDRREYLFEVRTNNGYRKLETTIDASRIHFAHHFEQRYGET